MNVQHVLAASDSEPLPRPDSTYREAWLTLHDRIVALRDEQPERALTGTWEIVLKCRGAREACNTVLVAFDEIERGLGIDPRS